MKKTITFVLIFAITSFSAWAQSIEITGMPTSIQAGNTLTVDYEYTSASPCKISCGVYLMSGEFGWTWVSTVVYDEKNSVPAGTNVAGTFNLVIPAGTVPTASLTGTQNYKVQPILSNLSGGWLAGDYSVNNYNITAAGIVPSVSFTSVPSSTQVGSDLTVNYKYTTAAAGGKVALLVSKNGGVNPWDYISTVAYTELTSAAIGTNVTGSFTVPIPAETTPTTGLTGNQNYRITIEIFDSSNTWLAGNYDNVNYNLTSSLSTNGFDYNKLSVYPNPVNTTLKIANTSNLSNPSFLILNTSGQTVQKLSSFNDEGIDVSNLNAGVYILSINSDEGNKEFKFIKQ